MTNRALRIGFRELPPRPYRLNSEQLSAVYGGCRGFGDTCGGEKSCCADTECLVTGWEGRCCRKNHWGGYDCYG
jgi:hypothetical protein